MPLPLKPLVTILHVTFDWYQGGPELGSYNASQTAVPRLIIVKFPDGTEIFPLYLCFYWVQNFINLLQWYTQSYTRLIITSERSKQSSNKQSYMDRLVDIQSAVKPLKKIGKKLKYIFRTSLRPAESFKTMNRSDSARPDDLNAL